MTSKIIYTIKATGETGVAAGGVQWVDDVEIPYDNARNAMMISHQLKIEETGFRNIYSEGEYDEEDIEDGVDTHTFETDQILFEHLFTNHETVVVTRHDALVEYLKEIRIIRNNAQVITQVDSPDQIKGAHVIGVLPAHLAIYADKVTNIPMIVPTELRGVELTLDQVRQYAGRPITYRVEPA